MGRDLFPKRRNFLGAAAGRSIFTATRDWDTRPCPVLYGRRVVKSANTEKPWRPGTQHNQTTRIYIGAGRGTRTPTVLPPADFESAASTDSAIPAKGPGANASGDRSRA